MNRQIKQQIEFAFEEMAKAVVREHSQKDCKLQLMMIVGMKEFQKSLENNRTILNACESNSIVKELDTIRESVENKYINK